MQRAGRRGSTLASFQSRLLHSPKDTLQVFLFIHEISNPNDRESPERATRFLQAKGQPPHKSKPQRCLYSKTLQLGLHSLLLLECVRAQPRATIMAGDDEETKTTKQEEAKAQPEEDRAAEEVEEEGR